MFHKCPYCAKYSITLDALRMHINYAHHGGVRAATPAQPLPKRYCLICEGATHGVDALCVDCRHMPEDDIQTALKGKAELGEFSDWHTHDASHPEHMLDRNEPPRMHWYAVVSTLVAHHGFVLDDGAGYGE